MPVSCRNRMSNQESLLQHRPHAFLAVLKACSKLKDFAAGFQTHVEVVRIGGFLKGNLLVGTALVDMYCKCGSLDLARRVFDDVCVQDVVSWTSLIAGYAEHGKPEQALDCFEQMKHEGIIPNGFTFVCSLKACSSLRTLSKIHEIHAEMEQQGLPRSDIVVGNAIVDVYAKCGSVSSMQQAFSRLPTKDVVSWTSLIGGYVEHGYGDRALESLEQMQSEGVRPNALTYVCSLKACASIGDKEKGEALHGEIGGKGLATRNLYLAAALMDMYSGFGSVRKAKEIFDDVLLVRDVRSWTSLIAGFSDHGHSDDVLRCFEQMKMESIPPDSIVSFVCCFKACGCTGAIGKGQQLHSVLEACRTFDDRNHVVLNALLDMYVRCGSLSTAQYILDSFLVQNVASWNALISGYVDHGDDVQALECLNRMQHEGVLPTAVTAMNILKACAHLRSLQTGIQIHTTDIESQGLLGKDIFIGSSLIDMYAKCGAFDRAQDVLRRLPVRDAISWTALLVGCVEHGRNEEAVEHLQEMQLEGVLPNALTLAWSLKACSCTGDIGKAREIHAELARRGNGFLRGGVGDALVGAYCVFGSLRIAQELFDNLPARDCKAWSVLIAGYLEHGLHTEALGCLAMVWMEGLVPDAQAFVCGLRCCGCVADATKGRRIYSDIEKLHCSQDVGNALIDMYAKCGLPDEAQKTFDCLRDPGVVSWNALISGYADCGRAYEALECLGHMLHAGVLPDAVTYICSLRACHSVGETERGRRILAEVEKCGLEGTDPYIGSVLVDMHVKCGSLAKARQVLDDLPVKNLAAWNALLTAYSDQGQGETALRYLEQMQSPWNSATYVCCLRACATIGAVDKGHQIHTEIQEKGLLDTDHMLGSALVDMYFKCGHLPAAEQLFERLGFRDVVSWTVLIGGYARVGELENVFSGLERMGRGGVRPDVLLCKVVLNACSRAGWTAKGQMYWETMSREHGIVHTTEHHVCMVDALGRLGHIEEAVQAMDRMLSNSSPGLMLWSVVLSACRNTGNMELAKEAFRNAVRLNGADPAAYVLMSHIHSECNG